jgi:carboxylesterase type B
MSTISVQHPELAATFKGVVEESHGEKINKFKGIKYADIPARFERAQPVSAGQLTGKTVDATQYGSVPQILDRR